MQTCICSFPSVYTLFRPKRPVHAIIYKWVCRYLKSFLVRTRNPVYAMPIPKTDKFPQ